MYTEDEAREKWCPHVRYEDRETGVASNTWADRPLNLTNTCVGSKCMAWRWGKVRREEQPGYPIDTPTGYCGLSGSPYMGGE